MRKGRKPYENKADFDPGRLRNKIEFYGQVWQDDGFGGGQSIMGVVRTTVGAKMSVSLNSLSHLQQLGTIAASTDFTTYFYVMLRKYPNFYPEKDMDVAIDGVMYKVRGVMPQDEPTTFIKILCARTE